VLTESLLGIRPRREGLEIRPVIPASWPGFTARRRFRGTTLTIEVRQARGATPGLYLDGAPLEEAYVPADRLTRPSHTIRAVIDAERDGVGHGRCI